VTYFECIPQEYILGHRQTRLRLIKIKKGGSQEMNSFDVAIQTFLTQITLAPLLNHAIRVVAGLYTFKGFVLVPILWWIWSQPGERREWRREMVIATIASGLVALATGRLLARCLPFRDRYFSCLARRRGTRSAVHDNLHLLSAGVSRFSLSDRPASGSSNRYWHHLLHDTGLYEDALCDANTAMG
jgi:hypothetical protein